MVRSRTKSSEYLAFLQFAKSTFGAEARPGHPGYHVETRCIGQLKSMMLADLGVRLSDEDASHLLHLQPSRMTEPSRSVVFAQPEQVVRILASCRQDRRLYDRRGVQRDNS